MALHSCAAFTMNLFIGNLAFVGSAHLMDEVKVGGIGGVVSGQQTHLAQNRQASIDAAAVGQSRLLACCVGKASFSVQVGLKLP